MEMSARLPEATFAVNRQHRVIKMPYLHDFKSMLGMGTGSSTSAFILPVLIFARVISGFNDINAAISV